MNTVLCIGEALIDMICTDTDHSITDGVHFLKKCGGAPTNVAIALKALGGEVINIACVGDDPFGNSIIKTLKEFNVNTEYIIIDKNHFTTIAYVSLKKNGERDFYFQRGADANIRIQDIHYINLKPVSIFHFGSATAFLEGDLLYSYIYLLKQGVEHNKFICFDPNYRELLFGNKKEIFIKKSNDFLKHAHLIKMSDEEALLLSKKSTLDEALEYFSDFVKGVITITLGKEGTLLYLSQKKQKRIIPSIEIESIDSTGAGDSFVATLLYQMSQLDSAAMMNISEDQWVHFIFKANIIGAKTCTYYGAIEAYKHLNNSLLNEVK